MIPFQWWTLDGNFKRSGKRVYRIRSAEMYMNLFGDLDQGIHIVITTVLGNDLALLCASAILSATFGLGSGSPRIPR